MTRTERANSPAVAELVGLLDESHLANSIVYRAMHGRGLIVADGQACRLSDGSLDRRLFFGLVNRLLERAPSLALGLEPGVLGLSAPLWMPVADLSAEEKVVFVPGRFSLDDPEDLRVLIGLDAPPLPRRRSPWELRVHELTDGRVCVTVRVQHVLGDGRWLVRAFQHLMEEEPWSVDDVAVPTAPRRPASRVSASLIVARAWFAEQGGVGPARKRFARHRLRRRARRVAVRWRRPALEIAIRVRRETERRLPPLKARSVTVPLDVVQATARKHGVSIGVLVPAACLAARLGVRSEEPARLLLPIWHPEQSGGRNAISVRVVDALPGQDFADIVRLVDQRARSGDSSGARPELGYATFVPFSTQPTLHLGPARVDHVQIWPTGHPQADVACLANTAGASLSVQLLTQVNAEPDATLELMRAHLLGQTPS